MLTCDLSTPALASQAVFRTIMDVTARPGKVLPLPFGLDAPAPLSRSAAALMSTLLDYETSVWLDRALAGTPAVAQWINFQTGARIVTEPQLASFAIIADPAHVPPFERFSLGTGEYPDRSTTLVLQVESLGQGRNLHLSGPGIAGSVTFSADPLPDDIEARLAGNRALFPRGVDLILVSRDAMAALPRSVRLIAGR